MMRDISATKFPVNRFTVYSLLGKKNYSLIINNGASIIVGPNGSGKSHFLSILYLVLSRQWVKLTDYNFERIKIELDDQEFSFAKDDILESTSLLEPLPNKFRQFYTYLLNTNGFGDFVSSEKIEFSKLKEYSDLFKIPTSSISINRSKMRENLDNSSRFFEIDYFIERLNLGPIIYMPTYRRIEKYLSNIIPSSDKSATEIQEPLSSSLVKKGFVEIVGAGMRDVQNLIEGKILEISVEKQKTTEKAAQEYILDMLRGKIKNFSIDRLRNIDEKSFLIFIETLDNNLFREKDKENLKDMILGYRHTTKKSAAKVEEKYLGLYIEKLILAHEEIKNLEKPLAILNGLARSYIDPEKVFDFLSSSSFYTDENKEKSVDLDGLSSGEKQIIALFSYLLLLDSFRCILIIDEPELSLSVPWQKKLLPDIISTNKCTQIFAVTHSPFIFDNDLRSSITDTQSMSVSK